MRILVIGHTVEDHVSINGEDIIKPGGIYYTALALKNFISDEDSVSLNTFVQKENYNLFGDVYESLGKDYMKFVERIPKVYLTLHDFKERGETYESISQNLEISATDLTLFDGILINMITGFDITLNQLKGIRHAYNGLIFLDVHTLTRGLDENFKRNFRPVPNIDEWIASADIVQANVSELRTLSNKKYEMDAAEEILKYGAKIFILTKGELAARVYMLNNNEIISIFKSSVKIQSKNKLGCGDVFGAVFFYTFIKTKDVYKSLELANSAASYTASYEDINRFNGLRKDVFTRYN